MTIKSYVAALGQNIQFVAYMAHMGVTALIVEHTGRWRPYVAVAVVVASAIKEFYFDARYEKDTPQTFLDNLQDFAGYLSGATLGLMLGGK